VKTDVGQVDLVLRLSDGTSEKAINEIIARSQTQAQAMLSAGNYLDDSLKSLASPRVTFDTSPDNSICSDIFMITIALLQYEFFFLRNNNYALNSSSTKKMMHVTDINLICTK
jgi:hypothetical protein